MSSEVAELVANLALLLHGNQEEVNSVFSPLSVFVALSMTYVGSNSETEAEFMRVLYGGKVNKDAVQAVAGKLMKSLKVSGEKGVVLQSANQLFLRQQVKLLHTFVEVLEEAFYSKAEQVDFSNTDAATQHINSWVKKQTEGKVENLLKPGIIDANTQLMLVNAVYFKGDWRYKFDAKVTADDTFYSTETKTVRVPMMHLTGRFSFAETPEFQMLALPYVGEKLAFYILLPTERFGLRALTKQLTGNSLVNTMRSMSRVTVVLMLPKFKLEKALSLRDVLKNAGLKTLFTPGQADLSGMDGSRELFVSAVEHKAFIEVNEDGSEAAAATAVGISNRCASAKTDEVYFRADHPFLFCIADRETMNILFLGQYLGSEQ